MGSVKWVMSTARENMGKMVVGMLLSVLCVGFNVISPILYAQIIDDVIEGGQTDKLIPLCVGAIACAVLFVICTYTSQLLLEFARRIRSGSCVNSCMRSSRKWIRTIMAQTERET